MKYIILIFYFLSTNLSVFCQVANFVIPDTVCINQNISILNNSTGSSSYYWNFCSGNLANTPIGENLGNLGSLNGPVYSAIALDGNNYFVFITNILDGTLTRLSFGNSLTNYPVSLNLGTFGVLQNHIEGIQIKKDDVSGNWFGLIAGGETNNLFRLNFGNSLNNIPSAENLGNIGNLMSYSHTIYTFREGGNWYSFIINHDINTIIRLNFRNSLANFPTATNLGNIGALSGPVGLYPIQDNGIWYLYVVNRDNSTLSRLNFGSSLLNSPTGANLGDLGGVMNNPRSITFIKDCGQIFGFVVNETSNDIARLTFPNGLLSTPTGTSIGNIGNFSFPHHLSELFRVGDSLYTFIMNVYNNSISRLCFTSCINSSVSNSTLQYPPVFSYDTPGTYNVSLIVNEGLPTQSSICQQIVVLGPPTPEITGDTAICVGETINLISGSAPGYLYRWSGPNGFTSADKNIIIPYADTNNAGKYALILNLGGCLSEAASKNVIVDIIPIVNLGNDTTICSGISIELNAGNTGSNYQWSTGANSQTIHVEIPGNYAVTVYNKLCSATDDITIDECGTDLWFPNAFSPNNDGKNDKFRSVFPGTLYSYQVLVFNRWGHQLYESNDAYTGWNGTFEGKDCPDGIYFYIAKYLSGTGTSIQKERVKLGSVTLLR